MEFRARDVQFSHLRVGDLEALLVFVAVETALHGQSGLGLRIGDQFDDHPMGEERLAAPILRDEGKQPMSPAGGGQQLWPTWSRRRASVARTSTGGPGFHCCRRNRR